MRSLLAALLLALLVIASGCAGRARLDARPPDASAREGSGVLQAGAAKVDITPMPGVPLGGHSFEGGTGYGVWTRLWARAVYLEDPEGEPLLLIAADLWSIPAGLADAVVERLRDQHGLERIGRAQLLLAATHTHHSPANFSSSKLYNRAASPELGFDPELHEFLVRRISEAAASAVASRQPARLSVASRAVAAVARNRSTAPFAQNPEAPLLLAANAGLPTCPEAPADAGAPGVDPCRAIDPTLTVLRVDDPEGRPLALAGFFSVHATAMRNATDVYNGDLFAVATGRAEAALARARPELGDPVVALFNGPEGDVSPNWTAQGRATTVALGTTLGEAIVGTAGIRSKPDDEADEESGCGRELAGPIASRFARIELADQAVERPQEARTATRALPGKSILGGAEDGRTRLFERLPEGQTVARSRRAGQGPKRPAIPPALYALVFPKSTIPQEVPLSLHRVGPLAIAGLPGEFTTIMGMRIRTGLAASLPEGAPRPILIGLAGEYASYFVTPQEYALQHYEGASTMWGQYAGTLIADRMRSLAAGEQPESSEPARFDPGIKRRFALRGARAARALRGLGERLAAQLEIEGDPRLLPRLEFGLAAPRWSTEIWPRVTVERLDERGRWAPFVRDGLPVDERGVELLTFPLAIERERWRVAVWWIGEVPEGASFRLRSSGPDGRERCSQPFTVGHPASAEPVACAPRYEAPVDPREGLGVVPGRSSSPGARLKSASVPG